MDFGAGVGVRAVTEGVKGNELLEGFFPGKGTSVPPSERILVSSLIKDWNAYNKTPIS